MNLVIKIDTWFRKPYKNFVQVFIFTSLVYYIATLFDVTTAFLNFRIMYSMFMKYEVSELAKISFHGDVLASLLFVFLVVLPLLFTLGVAFVSKKAFGHITNLVIVGLVVISISSAMHLVGALSNIAGAIAFLG